MEDLRTCLTDTASVSWLIHINSEFLGFTYYVKHRQAEGVIEDFVVPVEQVKAKGVGACEKNSLSEGIRMRNEKTGTMLTGNEGMCQLCVNNDTFQP